MFDSCRGINIYMISVGPVLCLFGWSCERQRRGAELSQILELQQGRKWGWNLDWILDGPIVLSASRPWLESRALHFQAPEEKELGLMVPCWNFLALLCHLPDAESIFESESSAVQKEFKELFQSYDQGMAEGFCIQGWALEVSPEGLSALFGTPTP